MKTAIAFSVIVLGMLAAFFEVIDFGLEFQQPPEWTKGLTPKEVQEAIIAKTYKGPAEAPPITAPIPYPRKLVAEEVLIFEKSGEQIYVTCIYWKTGIDGTHFTCDWDHTHTHTKR